MSRDYLASPICVFLPYQVGLRGIGSPIRTLGTARGTKATVQSKAYPTLERQSGNLAFPQ